MGILNISNTRIHSSRLCTTHSSSHWGGLPLCILGYPLPPGCGPGDPPPGVGLETPPGQTSQLPPWVWAWGPPRSDPSASPLGVDLETPQNRPLNFPPGCGPGDLQGMLGYHLQCILGHPPHEQNSWHTLLKILPCPNFVAGGNKMCTTKSIQL